MKKNLLYALLMGILSIGVQNNLIGQCSGLITYTDITEEIDDGSSYNDYVDNLDCQWLIQPTSGNFIYIEFNLLNTEEGGDTVFVYKGSSTDGELIGAYSGYYNDSERPKLLIESPSVLIHFTTNGSVVESGFRLEYEALDAEPTLGQPTAPTVFCPNSEVSITFPTTGNFCQGPEMTNEFKVILSDADGTFESGTTNLYSGSSSPLTFTVPNDLESSSTYRIKIVSTHPILESVDNGSDIILNNVDLEISSSDANTFVAIGKDGAEPYQYSIDGVNYSTNNQFTGLTSGNNYTIYVRDANGCENSRVFRFNPPLECNQLLAAGGQGTTFTSHYLGANAGQVYVSYEMYPNPDQMDIFYNNELVASTNTLVSYQNALSFDYNPPAEGPFHCVIRIYAPNDGTRWDYTAGCPVPHSTPAITNSTLTTCGVTLVSPGFPGNYPDNANIIQVLKPIDPNTQTLKYSFDFFGVDSYDHLYVHDGSNVESALIDDYSGYNYKHKGMLGFATNAEGALTFNFQSNGYTNGHGFIVQAECVDKANAGINYISNSSITTCNYLVASPNYPENYNSSEEYIQTFTPATAGQKLSLSFLAFHTEASDNVYVYDGATTEAPLIGTYDETYIPSTIYATNEAGQLTLRFVSDGSVTYQGFLAEVKCFGDAAFLSYNIPGQVGETVVDATTNKIHVTMPPNTDLTNLIANFNLSESNTATINELTQVSGQTANNFSSPITYTVSSTNGASQNWEVNVSSEVVYTFTNSISPANEQIIEIDMPGDTLFVTESDIADSREWKYTNTLGGTFISFASPQTDNNYVPLFSASGNYYIACFSVKDGVTVKSNEVKVTCSSLTKKSIDISYAEIIPVIDGETDALWDDIAENIIDIPMLNETVSFTEDATFKAVWTQDSLYIHVHISDDDWYPHVQAGVSSWLADKIELYFDVNENIVDGGGPSDDAGHFQIAPGFDETGASAPTAYDFAYKIDAFGKTYVCEYGIPFSFFTDKNGVSLDPKEKTMIGFDVTVIDLDETGQGGNPSVKGRINWNTDGLNGESWETMDYSGELNFKDTRGVPPVVSFSADATNVNIGQTVTFTDLSTNEPTSWNWDFGDGYSSNNQNVAHSYNEVGVYTVTLTATNYFGTSTETRTDYITVTELQLAPEADFSVSATEITAGEILQFTDLSLNDPTSWSWEFGDGNKTDIQNPAYIYNEPGVYTVSLTATNDIGSDTETKTGLITILSTDISPVDFSQAIHIYPNPNNGKLFIEVDNIKAQIIKVEIRDVSGQLILQNSANSNQITELNLSSYAQGIYFVKVKGEKYTIIKKVILE